jgi:hypothetical protein
MRYTQKTFLKSDAHFANEMKTTVCHIPPPTISHIGKEKEKRKKEWVKEQKKATKKKSIKKTKHKKQQLILFGKKKIGIILS